MPVRFTRSAPEPFVTVMVAVLPLPAGSVTVIVRLFGPEAIAMTAENSPASSAVAVAVAPLASLRIRISDAACVLPFTVTVVPLTVLPLLGAVTVILGFDTSSVMVTGLDRALSPPGPMTDAVNVFWPFARGTPERTSVAVPPTGVSVAIVGSALGRVR